MKMPLDRPDADNTDPEVEKPSCRGRHRSKIGGIQAEVIHHPGLVAFPKADGPLDEGEHLRMVIVKWHPEDFQQ